MSVPKGKRRQSRFEAQHHYFKLRDEVTRLMLQDFGFSPEKYRETIDYYRRCHQAVDNVDEVTARYEKKCEAFNKWFIDKECDAVLEILRKIENEFTRGNSTFPSDTPARLVEFVTRRYHMNNAIAECYALKQDHSISRTIQEETNMEKTLKITLADGTVLDNLEMNGNNYISEEVISDDAFEDNLHHVEVFDSATDVKTVLHDCELVQNIEVDGGCWFTLREKTEEELSIDALNGAIIELAEIIGELAG